MNINNMPNYSQEIRKQLFSLAEEQYRHFMSSLIPNCNNILGIRMPILHKLAKSVCQSNWQSYISFSPTYFEETMLQALIIGQKVTLPSDIVLIKNFIPQITNWAVCDTFCSRLKFMKKYQDESLKFITPHLKSSSEFEVRFALVSLLNHFVDKEHLCLIFQILDNFKHSGYYAQMAAAWLLSICFIKFPDQTTTYLKTSKLDNTTFNKAIQKIIESHQTKKTLHPFLKKLKR